MFIAAFSLLFVVEGETPKVPFITHLGIAINLALSNFLWLCLETWIVARLNEVNGYEGGLLQGGAQAWDSFFGFGGIVA